MTASHIDHSHIDETDKPVRARIMPQGQDGSIFLWQNYMGKMI